MNKDDLQFALGNFESSYITSFNVDLFNKEIVLDIVIYEADKEINHQIAFQNVSAFYFSNGSGSRRFELKKWELIELSDIGFHRHPVDHIACTNDIPEVLSHNCDPNFRLEMWGAVLLIEAKEVIIDDKLYQAI